MALTTTTLSAAYTAGANVLTVASASGFAAGNIVKIDEEEFVVASTYVSGTTIPVRGGQNGTFATAHVSSANVVTGLGSDFANPNATVLTAYALSGRRRKVLSYSASGAITLPLAGEDMVAVIIGTSTLTMTLASPTTDNDGSVLTIIGNGKSQSTVAYTTTGYGNAGANYVTATFQNGGLVAFQVMAMNGFWVVLNAPWTGTSTSLSIGIGA